MMASVTRQGQGSLVTFPSRPVSWNKRVESKQLKIRVYVGGRTNRPIPLKYRPCLRIGPRGKSLKIVSFKGPAQNDEESSGSGSGFKSLKKSAKISYVPENGEGTLIGSSPTEDDEKTEGSRAIQTLFRNWLTLLRSPLPPQNVEKTLGESFTPEVSETQDITQIDRRVEIARAACGYFWALDSRVKIPLMIFVPLNVGVNMICGAEVSKDLTPLWIFGPMFVALQIQIVQWLCALYLYSFKQTITVSKKLKDVYNYIVFNSDQWRPVVKIDSKAVKHYFGTWLQERNLDLMDIWPFYRKWYRILSYNKSEKR